LWILSFPQVVSPDAEGCWHHCFSIVDLWADTVDEVVDSVECQIGSGEQRQALEEEQRKKALEQKMDNVIWKMNLIIVVVVCVVFGCLLEMYAAKK
jgi:F0F1-type ATP synthase assembly protein I